MADSTASTAVALDEFHPELSLANWIPSHPPNFLSRHITAYIMRYMGRQQRPPPGIVQMDKVIPRLNETSDKDGVPIVIVKPNPTTSDRSDTATRRPGILWIHGGGMVAGNHKMDLWSLYNWATPATENDDMTHLSQGAVVISPDYRLAPANPAPALCDDCYAAWKWMVDHADELGIDTSRLVIAGASAGGGLAAITAQRILDDQRARPELSLPLPALQLLVYPMLDDRTVVRCDTELKAKGPGPKYVIWNEEWNRYGWTSYLNGQNPGCSGAGIPRYGVPARREDLSGLPRTWIGVGTRDLFCEEGKEYAKRLEQAGVQVDLDVVQGACHAFEALAPSAQLVKDFNSAKMRALRAALE